MKLNLLFAVLGVALLLTGCGGGSSPAQDFMQACEGSEAECKCLADFLDERISKDEFEELNQLFKLSDDELGEKIFTEGFVNEHVTDVFITGAKLCEANL